MAKRPKRFAEGDQVSDYDSGEGRGSAGTFETVTPSKAKSKIVTKEELEKSGLSLRDYMNKQQGLTRRGDSKAKIDAIIAKGQANNEADRIETEAAEAEPPSTYTNTGSVSRPTVVRSAPREAKDIVAKEAISSIKASGRKYPDMSALQAPAKRSGMTAMGPRMASGGSASSRADGIATKGKTRGKMC
jgi:hypothetical protein